MIPFLALPMLMNDIALLLNFRLLLFSLQFSEEVKGDEKPENGQHDIRDDSKVQPVAFRDLLFFQSLQKTEVLDRGENGESDSKKDEDEADPKRNVPLDDLSSLWEHHVS
jgi:hypothetical protein